ncbi:MAG: AAA family ATPase [Puniceicoccales bacterium]|nr:AAA family ATPase [Puniceicoccales bacterium]
MPVVTGARQTGKSTLLRHVFPQAAYVTLDDPLTRQAALDDPRTFLARAPQLIIDEIQSLPELLPHIISLIEIKQTATPRAEHFKTIKNLFPLFPNATGYVCSLTAQEETFSANLFSVPFHALIKKVFPEFPENEHGTCA